ncbi:capping protein, Arp2/3 and myosin-I linker protein 2 isoform X2 [Polyodon spathula]|uniref:capping protein, Arp2/3 and myosin-I linker protein 2 isoform X2 n=1 Tax=Polyodon spathula TaxID=7913 RepID=UPI001B7E96A4|nr:capping protein, Arp2/3 and myosin-I linker protein 2 isoform X2 [Polyodon spathula]
MAVNPKPAISYGLQDSISKFLKPENIQFMGRIRLNRSKSKTEERILVMTLWRAHILQPSLPVKVDSSFSYLEICAIIIKDITQAVIETDSCSYSFCLMSLDDLEHVVSHVTASLRKIFPDSSPGKLLKKIPPDLQERFQKLTSAVEEHQSANQGPCGGFSETYAGLCDYNEFTCREEIQWDVDNIYHSQDCREFNLLDFGHMDSRDVALAVAALSFNQWFTKLSCKDFKLGPEVLEQVLYVIHMSPKLEEVSLESSGLKSDFAQKMALALSEHPCSALHSINLSGNPIEDRGITALSQQFEKLASGLTHLTLSRTGFTARGLSSLSQALSVNKSFSSSLRLLDLSGNAGIFATEDTTNFFSFLASPNELTHLDLSATDCPLGMLFVPLLGGCCSKLSYLNLSKNVYSHKKVKDIPAAVKEFFSLCVSLKFLGLSASRLPAEMLRLLLQGLACNTHLSDVQLDLSSCELRSAGAQVIQDHIFEANAIGSLDLSDNGFDSDMVTLVLSIGRSQSIRHLSLGKNFCMKSKALADVLCRIVQLIQEEECPLESLSVADSKLKAAGTTILINALGSNPSLSKIDISGNCMGDTGAKMLAKALQINTKLRTVIWDRNNTTAVGFLDVANALEKNYTLKSLALPVSDVAQASRSNPEKTEEALQKIQSSLLRNNQRCSTFSDRASRLQQGIITSSSEQLVSRLCARLQGSMASLSSCSSREVQEDIITAEEVLCEARASINLLPTLYQMGRAPSSVDVLHYRLKETAEEITQEISQEIQLLVHSMLDTVQRLCPKVIQRTRVRDQLTSSASSRTVQSEDFVREALIQQAGEDIVNKLSELKLSHTVTLAESIIDAILQDLSTSQRKLAQHVLEHTKTVPQIMTSKTEEKPLRKNKALFELAEMEFPTDEYVPVIRRHALHARSIRPAPSMKSLVELDSESQQDDSEAGASQAGLSISSMAPVKSRPASTEDAAAAAALSNNLPASSEPESPQPLMDLPIEGQRLKHYTRARPRPNRRNKQPPSKPNVQAVACENEENVGNVDEGVEEFFTKKLRPEDPLKSQQPVKAQEPSCSASPPSSSKTIKKKFGDFFAFKKPRSARGAKGEGGPEGSPSVGLRLKKTSIADLIRPLREAARAAERAEESAGKAAAAAAASVTASAASSVTDSPAAQPPGPIDRERSKTLDSDREKSKTPDADRKLKPSRRSLREGKSQSLILLPGVNEEENLPGNHGKKHFSDKATAEGAQTFEQKVHVMLHRIGVTKNKEGELRKADSEGTIVDSKPEPPPQFMKPRTMSTSSDIRRPIRPGFAVEPPGTDCTSTAQKSSQEHASPAFHKILGKPPVPDQKEKSSESLSSSPKTPVACPEQAHPDRSTAGAAQEADSLFRCKKDTPTPSPRRGTSLGEQKRKTEPAMPAPNEDNLPVPRPRIKQIHNRRAVSVHEEQLRDQSSLLEPEDLRAALSRLQRSPVRKMTNQAELPLFSESQPEEMQGDRKAEETRTRPATREKRAGSSEELQVPQTARQTLPDQRT